MRNRLEKGDGEGKGDLYFCEYKHNSIECPHDHDWDFCE